ncbi:MAG: hypothetical protein J5I59_07220 [Saprospiraceae bacterium]|nr:hypothetical protein [Saprospiraceae bacterium]
MAENCHTHNIEFGYEAILYEENPTLKIKGTSIRNIYFILKELFNNTLKHSHADKVNLTVTLNPKNISIRYSDNGTSEATNISKTGNGLKNIEKRVREEHGTIHTDTQSGWTTTLTLDLGVIVEADITKFPESDF